MDNLEEMGKFQETYTLPILNQEETGNMNRLVTSNEIKSIIKKKKRELPKNKVQDHMASQENSTTFKIQLTSILLK